MKKRALSRAKSSRNFKKNSGTLAINKSNPRKMRGGIRF